MESSSNFKHFERKMMVIDIVFLRLPTVKELVKPLSKKRGFRASSQHVKGSQTLVKSA